MSSKRKPKEEDPELILKNKFRAKCRFRALSRLAVAHSYWMLADRIKYEGDDVKRRVEQVVRSKAKHQMLSLNDKALLNKPAVDRTPNEKHYLYRILGGLKCFKKYPVAVKRKLTAVTYFRYYGPGRVIVRQHQDAHALYFIVTGEVIVSQLGYDDLLQTHYPINICNLYAGDMFGEVSLLHNIKRTATCTSNAHCELLAVLKEDFKSVLQDSVQKQWEEVLLAMSGFSYFSTLDEVSLRDGCIVAKLKNYEKDEVILGDGVGIANFVYFVLSGKCQMIESLNMFITERLDRKYFTLYDPYVEVSYDDDDDIDAKYFSKKREPEDDIPDDAPSCPRLQSLRDSKKSQNSTKFSQQSIFSKYSVKDIYTRATVDSKTSFRKHSIKVETTTPDKLAPKLYTFFMQVCQMNTGASFGFGENMRDRRIIALTPVRCLLLPKVWLLQKNTANIWTRIQHYLNKKIPNKQDLFKVFVESYRWQEFKDQLVQDVVARSNAVNATTIHDVPMSIRMEEIIDLKQ